MTTIISYFYLIIILNLFIYIRIISKFHFFLFTKQQKTGWRSQWRKLITFFTLVVLTSESSMTTTTYLREGLRGAGEAWTAAESGSLVGFWSSSSRLSFLSPLSWTLVVGDVSVGVVPGAGGLQSMQFHFKTLKRDIKDIKTSAVEMLNNICQMRLTEM